MLINTKIKMKLSLMSLAEVTLFRSLRKAYIFRYMAFKFLCHGEIFIVFLQQIFIERETGLIFMALDVDCKSKPKIK